MKKLLTILLLTAALTSGAQNIWRAPSVFEQPVNFKAAISQTSGTDSLKITTVDTTSALLHGNGAIRITPTKVTIGNSTDTGYRVSAGAQRFEIQKGNTDSIRLTIVDDTCHVDGTFSAWEFTPPLPGGGGSGWSLTGNSGTNPAVNFIGTTDNVPVIFKTNNTISGKIGTTATFGTSFGVLSLQGDTSTGNSAFGAIALRRMTTGTFNTGLGFAAGAFISSGSNNVTIGGQSAGNIITGSNNTFIGYNTTGSSGLSGAATSNAAGLGYNANAANFSTAIGANSQAPDDSTIVLGDTSATNGVGIGTAYPEAKLDIRGTVKIADGTQAAAKVLTSDANGLSSWQTLDSLIIDSVATTGDTAQLAGNAFVAVIATGAITDLVLQFPATPYNNMTVTAKFDYAVTTLTADGNGATVYGFPASTVLGLYCKWVYNSATNSWY